MFGSAALEVLIGLLFVFILISIVCSAIREAIEAWLKTRAAYLEHAIRELLNDKDGTGLAKSLYEHPLIYSLFSGGYKPGNLGERPNILANGRSLPSYIPSKNFAVALMDITARGPGTDDISAHPESPVISLEALRTNIMNLNSPFVQRALLTALDTAQNDLNKAQQNIEDWYDSAMDRISGWYKRSTHWVLFWIGLFVAVALNVNTITIADYLFRNDTARKALVARAEAAAKDSAVLSQNYTQARKDLDSLNLPIGWAAGWGAPRRHYDPGNSYAQGYVNNWWNNFFGPLLGLLVTALAATMGAPFWFDLLNKVMVIRSTVKPHEKSPEEASEDRQTKAQQNPTTLQGQQSGIETGGGGATPPINITAIPTPRDATSQIEGCSIETDVLTSDEDLPPSVGGVA